MTHERRSSGVGNSRRSRIRSSGRRFGRWAVAAAALTVTFAVLPMGIDSASSSSLGKVSVIARSASSLEASLSAMPGHL